MTQEEEMVEAAVYNFVDSISDEEIDLLNRLKHSRQKTPYSRELNMLLDELGRHYHINSMRGKVFNLMASELEIRMKNCSC